MSGWSWFEPQDGLNTMGETRHWQACFDSPAGQKVLDDLERHFLQTALGPDASASAIWMREGQRALVLQIRRLVTVQSDAQDQVVAPDQ